MPEIADPAPLKLLSSMATRELLAALAVKAASELSQPLDAQAAGGVDVARRIQSGEAVDIVVLASNVIDKLLDEGRLLPGSRVDLARSGIAVAVPAGAPRPDIGSEAAVRQAVMRARKPGFSTGPSGVYLEKLFARWGILAQIRPHIVVPPPGIPVGSLVASGECDLGFQQLSELLNVAGIEVLGPLPPAIQLDTVFSAGIPVACRQPDAARRVLDYFASAAMAATKIRYGMQAVQSHA